MNYRMYRGKRTDNGEWVYGYFGVFKGRTQIYVPFTEEEEKANKGHIFSAIGGLWYTVIPETVGQEIGLPDKKGKKIFEGDVFSHFINYLGRRINGVVAYDITLAAYMWKPKGLSSLFLADVLSGNGAEIIGNIHDNPELLEVKP